MIIEDSTFPMLNVSGGIGKSDFEKRKPLFLYVAKRVTIWVN